MVAATVRKKALEKKVIEEFKKLAGLKAEQLNRGLKLLEKVGEQIVFERDARGILHATVPSESERGKSYEVTFHPMRAICTCAGASLHERVVCKHMVAAALQAIATKNASVGDVAQSLYQVKEGKWILAYEETDKRNTPLRVLWEGRVPYTVYCIHGAAGVGKTSLALAELLIRYEEHKDDPRAAFVIFVYEPRAAEFTRRLMQLFGAQDLAQLPPNILVFDVSDKAEKGLKNAVVDTMKRLADMGKRPIVVVHDGVEAFYSLRGQKAPMQIRMRYYGELGAHLADAVLASVDVSNPPLVIVTSAERSVGMEEAKGQRKRKLPEPLVGKILRYNGVIIRVEGAPESPLCAIYIHKGLEAAGKATVAFITSKGAVPLTDTYIAAQDAVAIAQTLDTPRLRRAAVYAAQDEEKEQRLVDYLRGKVDEILEQRRREWEEEFAQLLGETRGRR